ncbi:hypothetical protein ASZ90_019431 [hydrocarbon metagenome]|uniref:Uncharacterized protein n=1 Tax=hydrocarbon metagenome TaxID=938273 RepID=A0A0W8E3J2_9ZZZZ
MYYLSNLSQEELKVVRKIDEYFSLDHMSFQEKLFHALLIAQYELEAQYYSNEFEKSRIVEFRDILLILLSKFPRK